jgi:alkyldihydroxyacetonephosphate synthase
MTDVKHMKWWGWGLEGVGFHFDDKPAFAPFVEFAVGLDLNASPAAPTLSLDDITVPASVASESVVASLATVLGFDALASGTVTTDVEERVVHTYGKSIRDLLRIRGSLIERAVDIVAYPADEDQVLAVVRWAAENDVVVIPFGGGTNISGSLEPLAGESRVVLSLDLGLLDKVVSIDAGSGLATIQAGAQGPDLEAELGRRGWTLGHFPDSFTHSTLGGWVATRSSGMQSDVYGDIADIARGMRVVRPGGVTVIRPLPSTSTGPSVREMILGSEGRLGVITEVTVQVHRLPEVREIQAYFFPNWEAGTAAMAEIAASDARPTVTRVSDARETGFSLATSKESKKAIDPQKILFALLKRRGWDLDNLNLSFIGFEGSKSHVAYEKKLVAAIVKKHGGIGVGKGPGVLYDQKKFDTPYLRDFLLDRGAAADVSETAAPWSRLNEMHDSVYAAANAAYDELGVKGWIMSHLSHSYHSGACLYFTFAFVHDGVDPIGQYDVVKRSIQQAFIEHGGTLSHHHAVGLEHAPWLEQDLSAGGVELIRGLFGAADPAGILNPGKITA